jgi:tetratricopeptide (TPR) repeat protein
MKILYNNTTKLFSRRMMKTSIFFFFLFTNTIISQDLKSIFEEANYEYNRGDYNKSISLYEKILEKGSHSSALYYNLGNANYRLNKVAESIYYFEKAKEIDPSNEDIIFNSSFAENMTIDYIEALPKSQMEELKIKIFKLFSINQWSKITILLSWILMVLFSAYVINLNPFLKRVFFTLSLLNFIILILSFSITFFVDKEKKLKEYAILFSDQANIWSEPNQRGDIQFILHKGTKVSLIEKLDEWQKIRIVNGSEGWIKSPFLKSLKE